MAENLDLARIIEGCKNGESQCFSQLVDLYSGRCYGYYYRVTGNNDISDELLSELFIKLVEKIATYRGGSFESWLFRIASNIFHDYLRTKQRRKKLLDAKKEQLETELTEEKQSDNDSQLSFKEIAEMRSEPIGTTLAKLHRGLKKIRELMEG
jgi:RNA polymerase sigma factor (sigma-70 family)